jgi:hypothetical protein
MMGNARMKMIWMEQKIAKGAKDLNRETVSGEVARGGVECWGTVICGKEGANARMKMKWIEQKIAKGANDLNRETVSGEVARGGVECWGGEMQVVGEGQCGERGNFARKYGIPLARVTPQGKTRGFSMVF